MVILFGGSFDPIHDGHLHLAQKILAAYSPRIMYLVPAKRNPLKDQTSAPGAARLAMIRLALKEFNDERIHLLDCELARPEPSYTLLTVQSLLEKGASEVSLVMGNEVFASLPRWHEPKLLLELANVIVVTREQALAFAPDLVVSAVGIKDLAGGPERWRHSGSRRWIERRTIGALPFSATQIRDEISQRTGSHEIKADLPGLRRSVWEYIKENRLYAVNRG